MLFVPFFCVSTLQSRQFMSIPFRVWCVWRNMWTMCLSLPRRPRRHPSVWKPQAGEDPRASKGVTNRLFCRAAFSFGHSKKNSRWKKLETRGKNWNSSSNFWHFFSNYWESKSGRFKLQSRYASSVPLERLEQQKHKTQAETRNSRKKPQNSTKTQNSRKNSKLNQKTQVFQHCWNLGMTVKGR